MAFQIIEKNGKQYRKNINPNGKCKYHVELRCVCCNPDCDYNCSIDDETEEEMENILDNIIQKVGDVDVSCIYKMEMRNSNT